MGQNHDLSRLHVCISQKSQQFHFCTSFWLPHWASHHSEVVTTSIQDSISTKTEDEGWRKVHGGGLLMERKENNFLCFSLWGSVLCIYDDTLLFHNLWLRGLRTNFLCEQFIPELFIQISRTFLWSMRCWPSSGTGSRTRQATGLMQYGNLYVFIAMPHFISARWESEGHSHYHDTGRDPLWSTSQRLCLPLCQRVTVEWHDVLPMEHSICAALTSYVSLRLVIERPQMGCSPRSHTQQYRQAWPLFGKASARQKSAWHCSVIGLTAV